MQEWIINFMEQYGYLGILLLIAVENIFPPIPSEVILTFGGFMTTFSTLKPVFVILYSTFGSVLGAFVLYYLGRKLNAQRLERWLGGRWGRILHFKPQDVRRAEGWFQKHGKSTVFFCRFIPIVRSLISIPAGMSRIRMRVFVPLTALGTLIWNTVLVLLGAAAGASWENIAGYMGAYSSIALVLLALGAVVFLALFYRKRLSKKKEINEEPHTDK